MIAIAMAFVLLNDQPLLVIPAFLCAFIPAAARIAQHACGIILIHFGKLIYAGTGRMAYANQNSAQITAMISAGR